jgi:pimeloyl-ACP methyl ester carboxylesterase
MKISANGITLHAEESGTGDLALLFLHYWGGTARSWAPVMDALPRTLRSIALDARGWGESDRPGNGYDIATMADDVEAAVAALELKRYVLVGHSMGGKVAQLLASRRPAGLAGLVLVAPSPAQGKTLAAPEREGMKGAYASPGSVAWTIDNVLSERPLREAARAQIIAGSLAGDLAAKESWPVAAISEDVSGDLARIEVPVLVIGGEKDKVDSVDMLRTVVVPSLPGATLNVVSGAGHLLPLEAPREVAGLIGDFAAIAQ